MERHKQNSNLQIWHESSYLGIPVMIDKGPFVASYLETLKGVMDCSLSKNNRVFVFRFDLRFPEGWVAGVGERYNSYVVNFLKLFKRMIDSDREAAKRNNPYAHETSFDYMWVRESSVGVKPHYHFVMFLNADAYFTLGKLSSSNVNMIGRLSESWGMALGLMPSQWMGLVNIPDNPKYHIDKNAHGCIEAYREVFYRCSYLCKVSTKVYGVGERSIGSSRVL